MVCGLHLHCCTSLQKWQGKAWCWLWKFSLCFNSASLTFPIASPSRNSTKHKLGFLTIYSLHLSYFPSLCLNCSLSYFFIFIFQFTNSLFSYIYSDIKVLLEFFYFNAYAFHSGNYVFFFNKFTWLFLMVPFSLLIFSIPSFVSSKVLNELILYSISIISNVWTLQKPGFTIISIDSCLWLWYLVSACMCVCPFLLCS